MHFLLVLPEHEFVGSKGLLHPFSVLLIVLYVLLGSGVVVEVDEDGILVFEDSAFLAEAEGGEEVEVGCVRVVLVIVVDKILYV